MVLVLEPLEKIAEDRELDLAEPWDIDTVLRADFKPTRDYFESTPNLMAIADILEKYTGFAKIWGIDFPGEPIIFAFNEALMNAQVHGNKGVPLSKVYHQFYYSKAGNLLVTRDEGEGFDYVPLVAAVQQDIKNADLRTLTGMKYLERSQYHIAYHGPGNIISIATPLPKPE